MKLLLTNDDGYGAPGLEALWAAAEGLGERIIVAPSLHLSGCSHQVTTHRPLRVVRHGENRYAVDGTPADCVRVALHRLVPDADWVLSGINQGGNLGADVYISGTVAAVREGVLHGWPGIAVSHYHRKGREFRWSEAADWVRPLLAEKLAQPLPAGAFWNINLPHLDAGSPPPEAVDCPLDPAPLPLSYRGEEDALHYDGDYHLRHHGEGTDVDICFGGRIAVTKIKLF
ncbi:MAG: 5'/3'-nucleotidase SurE [Armatimonadetes bacterium]|nr:5'/3'-nucleotidase SurE [Armatimonadota bacterium]